MEKTIEIGTQKLNLKATAGTLRRYRAMFHKDMMADMMQLEKSLNHNKKQGTEFSRIDLEIFENATFVMAKQAGATASNIDEWLDEFDIFDIYTILPEILDLWHLETLTMVESKKNLQKVAGQ